MTDGEVSELNGDADVWKLSHMLVNHIRGLTLDQGIDYATGLLISDPQILHPPDPPEDPRVGAYAAYAELLFHRYVIAAEEPGERLDLALELSQQQGGSGIRTRSYERTDALCPRFPTGIQEIDDYTIGGFYGVTIMAGEPGTGKSMQALVCALEAAAAGWKVVYFDCELGDANFNTRITRILDDCPGLFEFVKHPQHLRDEICSRIHWRSIDYITGLEEMFDVVSDCIAPWDEKLLVIVDNVNQIAKMLQVQGRGDEAWSLIRTIGEAAKRARRISDGSIAFLLLSELNRAGGVKGADLEYVGDVDVRFARCEQENETSIRIWKGREGGEKSYGDYERNWRVGRFTAPNTRLIELPEDPY